MAARERVEPLEVADLAGEGIVERRQLLPLHLVQRHPHRAGLAPARLVGMVVRELDLGSRRSRRGGAP